MKDAVQPTRRKRAIVPIRQQQALNELLALDREIVEISMRMYRIPVQHRPVMRAGSRRLHSALKRMRRQRTALYLGE